jgi:hypothetical protein
VVEEWLAVEPAHLRLDLDQPQNHVAAALAGGAQGAQAIEEVRLKPDQPLAIVGGVALEGLIKARAKPPPN